MSHFFFVRCCHNVCSGIVDHPFPNIKIDWRFFSTGSLLFSRLQMISGMCTQKKANEIPAEGNFRLFSQGASVWATWRKEGRQFSATKINFERPPTRGGACGWIRNSPKSACLPFHFLDKNLWRTWGSSQSGYCFSNITYFLNWFIHNNEFRKTIPTLTTS